MKQVLILTLIAFSLNSCAQKKKETASVVNEQLPGIPGKKLSELSVATFSAGCFWCVEAVYEGIEGVHEAVSGYSGGHTSNPTYEEVTSGTTGHAESVNVYYDSTKISYQTLLEIFFDSEDPTQVDGQGPDHGSQYRSIVFYRNDQEKQQAEKFIAALNASGKYDAPIAAEVKKFEKFWEAEKYHQDYVKNNPDASYVRYESIPRVKKFQKKRPELLKKQ